MLSIGLSQVPKERLDYEHVVKEKAFFKLLEQEILPYIRIKQLKPPTCFISYAWGEIQNELWVKKLEQKLSKAGINVFLDRNEDKRGKEIASFALEKIPKSDFVLVIGTPLYKEKYERVKEEEHILKAEMRLIRGRLLESASRSDTVIPVLLDGTMKKSFPAELEGFKKIPSDFVKNDYFEELLKLIKDLYGVSNQDTIFEGFFEKLKKYGVAIKGQISEAERKGYEEKRRKEIEGRDEEITDEVTLLKTIVYDETLSQPFVPPLILSKSPEKVPATAKASLLLSEHEEKRASEKVAATGGGARAQFPDAQFGSKLKLHVRDEAGGGAELNAARMIVAGDADISVIAASTSSREVKPLTTDLGSPSRTPTQKTFSGTHASMVELKERKEKDEDLDIAEALKISQNFSGANLSGQVHISTHLHLPPRKLHASQLKKKEQPICWNIPHQPNKFIGRKALLERLHEQLTAQDKKEGKESREQVTTQTLVVNALKGLGGIGKSELALSYIREIDYPYSLRAWFHAENSNTLKQQYFELALELGFKGERGDEAIRYLKRWFKEHSGWLLVYDNVNEEGIKDLLLEENGKIILTTRYQRWPTRYKNLEVPTMDEPEAIELVLSFLEESIREFRRKEEAELIMLVKTLGALPLALVQAGAYIAAHDISISAYLKLYQENEAFLLQEAAVEATYRTVAITWNISLQAIAKNPDTALGIDLLTACAYLSPDNIPKSLLLMWMKNTQVLDELAFNKCVERLKRYSMIKLEGSFLSIHRLVQVVIRNQQVGKIRQKEPAFIKFPPVSIEWYESMLIVVHHEFIRETGVLEDESRQRILLPHLESLIAHFEVLWFGQEIPIYGYVLADIGGVYFYLLGEFHKAQVYYERALPILEKRCGKNHLVVASTLVRLGNVQGVLGDAKKKQELIERALVIQVQEYGENHSEVARTLVNLGNAYGAMGNNQKKKMLLERALVIQEQKYGKKHSAVGIILANLGNAYSALGNPEKATELLERALVINEENYGKKHPEIARTLTNLGAAFLALGNPEKAIELLERALVINEDSYGKKHPEISIILAILGNANSALGNPEKAIELLERALVINEESYGKKHPEVARTLGSLGNAYIAAGDYQKGKEILEQSLLIFESCYDKFHPDIGRILYNIGTVSQSLGEIKYAKTLLERAFSIFKRTYGTDHPQTIQARKSLEGCNKQISQPIIQQKSSKYEIKSPKEVEGGMKTVLLSRSLPSELKDRNIIPSLELTKALKQCKIAKDGKDLPTPELALRRAAASGKLEIIKTLMKYVKDIDINQVGPSGKTAIQYAREKNKTEVVEFLKKFDARVDKVNLSKSLARFL